MLNQKTDPRKQKFMITISALLENIGYFKIFPSNDLLTIFLMLRGHLGTMLSQSHQWSPSLLFFLSPSLLCVL